jgi:hypothetical protein
MRTGEMHSHPATAELADPLLVEVLGGLVVGEERAAAGFDGVCPLAAAETGSLCELHRTGRCLDQLRQDPDAEASSSCSQACYAAPSADSY